MCPQNTFGWGFKLKLLSPASNLSNSVNALPPPNPAFVFPECSALEAVHSSVMCSSVTVKCSCTVLPQFVLALRGSLDATISIHKSLLEPTYFSLSPAWGVTNFTPGCKYSTNTTQHNYGLCNHCRASYPRALMSLLQYRHVSESNVVTDQTAICQ